MTQSKGNDMNHQKSARRKTAAFMLLFAAAVIAMAAVTSVSVMRALYPIKYPEIVAVYSERYSVDKELIYAVIKSESSFVPDAVSEAGALGLMQIMPDTLDWLCGKTGENLSFENLKEPDVSVRCGTFMLRLLLDEFGSEDTALAAYHAGRGRVNEWLADDSVSPDGKTLDNIPFRDTAHYVSKVTRAKNIYRNLYD